MTFLCCIALVGALAGLPASGPKDDSIRLAPTVKLRGRTAPAKIAKLPFDFKRVAKLSVTELKGMAVRDGALPNVGVADFLHLDARTPYVLSKGGLTMGRCSTDLDYNYVAFDVMQGGGVTLNFEAKPEAARYMIDFQVGAGPKPFELLATVDGNLSKTTVDSNTKHLVYVIDCQGGKHTVVVWSNLPCLFLVTGVDVSVVK
jgi:hypothetical protein